MPLLCRNLGAKLRIQYFLLVAAWRDVTSLAIPQVLLLLLLLLLFSTSARTNSSAGLSLILTHISTRILDPDS